MRRKLVDGRFCGELTDDVPDDLLGHALTQTRPALFTRRKSLPEAMPASVSQTSRTALTQSGIGTVRVWPAFPLRPTMAQCCSRCCRWEKFNSTASCRLKPQASNTARLPEGFALFGRQPVS
jgi:hypothetical protein